MAKNPIELLVIGGSAGSLEVILGTISLIKKDIPFAIIFVLHRKYNTDESLVKLLSAKTELHVKEPDDKEVIKPGFIYLAPADYHLLIEKDKSFSLDDSEKVNHSRPSIDVTFESAADVFGRSLVCLLLSGANADGVKGLLVVKRKGGRSIAQDPSSASVPYMPQQAIDNHAADVILHKDNMAAWINSLAS